jgi:hypothetical protein
MLSTVVSRRPIRLSAAAWALLLALSGTLTAIAQDMMQGPAYARQRMGAQDWGQRGGGYGGPRVGSFYPGYYGYGFGYGGPVITGSWYARPYPYHFDYYRYRWGHPDGGYLAPEPAAAEDCPCVPEPVAAPAMAVGAPEPSA